MGTGFRGRKLIVGTLGTIASMAALAPAAGADEGLLSESASAAGTISGSCTDRPLDGPGVFTREVTSPALGHLTATLSGGSGDWDLAVFSEGGATVAGSAYTGSDEVAGGYAFEGEQLTVQACALPGASGSPALEVGVDPVFRDKAGPAPSLLRVQTIDDEERAALEDSGLDVTESIGPGYTEVLAYGDADRAKLAELGLAYSVRVPDLSKVSASERRRELAASRSAARRAPGGLPSGRTGTYRRLFDYSEELKSLAADNKGIVRLFDLPLKTYEGRTVQGIEISTKVKKRNDGKPIFLQMGIHHAREWPSGEHAIEWAYELIKGYKSGNRKARRIVRNSRTIVVPIVNPDGFNASREAGELQGAAGGRGGDADQETVNILSHPNEYRRKNCRLPDDSAAGDCSQPAFGAASGGVDPNRNYGGFWGGPGASTMPSAEDYRGPGPFSEPETRNIRSLFSRKPITAFITNHTFTGLVLRPPGIAAQGPPVDERLLKDLGKQMAAENGYTNQPSYKLYDTTGGTEDWAYYATGSLGYTFEIGKSNFHPEFAKTVAEWNGTSPMAGDGGGNRAAYYKIANFVLKKRSHATIKGKGPKAGRIIIRKRFKTPTSPVIDDTGEPGEVRRFKDHVRARVRVRRSGRFKFAINPSTRPLVAQESGRKAKGPPSDPLSFSGAASPIDARPCGDAESEDPACFNDHGFRVPNQANRDNDSAIVRIEWLTPGSDWDMTVFRDSNNDGSSEGENVVVGTSAAGPSTSEQVTITGKDLVEGRHYVARVVNFLATEPYDGTVSFAGPPAKVKAKKERWTVVCKTRKGKVTGSRKLYIERGQLKRLNLKKGC